MAVLIALSAAIAVWQLNSIHPAKSRDYQQWLDKAGSHAGRGPAFFAFGNFGALDLDTLETSALPWTFLATALALREANGNPEQVNTGQIAVALKRFGFIFPKTIFNHPDLKLNPGVPLGISVGVIERSWPPIRITAMSLGCASCHAGPAYRTDGMPDPDVAVLGRPNTALDLEAFTTTSYSALKLALEHEPAFMRALLRLFPDITLRERLTLQWVALPKIRKKVSELAASIDRPLPFNNGAPGSTNGVAALKLQLGLASRSKYVDDAGFVSIPDLSDRNFRSALLADGAYAPKGLPRFHPIDRAEAVSRDLNAMAAIASFFIVPTMGLTSERAETAIPELTAVMSYLAQARQPVFPGTVDAARVAHGKSVYARACASCHGTYDDSVAAPKLLIFPNWAGTVGTDTSRVEAFSPELRSAVAKTGHGKRHLDVAATGVIAAPLLSGVWASAPYFTNGSVPTLRHLLEPDTRPVRFMTGGHRLDLEWIGIGGVLLDNETWVYPAGYVPHSKPVLIDTTKPGFSNRGHESEVRGLTVEERASLLEYLKLL